MGRKENKRYMKKRGCLKKVPYADIGKAKSAAVILFNRGEQGVQPYLCEFCGKYHVGHSSRGRSQ